jgi:putative endonuclease
LKKHKLLECAARFDVISILFPEGTEPPQIQHYRNAFEPVGFGQMFS